MTIRRQTRHVDDLDTAIAAQLKRPDGTVVDVSDLTVKFKMVAAKDGSTKVALTNTGVTKVIAASGKVSYSPVAANVDTEGTYYGYFVTIDDDDNMDTFPSAKGGFEILIEGDQ